MTTRPDATVDGFHDALVGADSYRATPGFFDRFMFNLHALQTPSPEVIVGAGIYPAKDSIDGFLLAVVGDEQRNLRFASELSATTGSAVGPLSWSITEPMRRWHLEVGPNPSGVELDLEWTARAPAWSGEIRVDNDNSVTVFDHLFQSGRYTGRLRIDGVESSVDGWFGQRDRSRGVRTMAGGQGLHLWVQPQFPDFCVGLLYVEGRDHTQLLLKGAVMYENGEIDDIASLAHDLTFTEDLDLVGGRLRIVTAANRRHDIDVDATGPGGFMAGAGYGGHHGRAVGRDQLEHDVYLLDGSVSPRTVDSALTDRLATFTCGDDAGVGIFEFAHSRSRSYDYRPTST